MNLKWQPIETAPQEDGVLHVRGVWVHSSTTGKPLYFDACAGFLQEGDFLTTDGDDHGWGPDSYEYWVPLPEPPETDRPPTLVGTGVPKGFGI